MGLILPTACCVNKKNNNLSETFAPPTGLSHQDATHLILEEILFIILELNNRNPELECIFTSFNELLEKLQNGWKIEEPTNNLLKEFRDFIFEDPKKIFNAELLLKKFKKIENSLSPFTIQKSEENLKVFQQMRLNLRFEMPECRMLKSAYIWNTFCGNKTSVSFDEFLKIIAQLCEFEKTSFSNSQISFIKNLVDINNDFSAHVMGWNNFYNNYWIIKRKRNELLKFESFEAISDHLELKYIPNNNENTSFQFGSIFSFHKEKCIYSNPTWNTNENLTSNNIKIDKNLIIDPVIIGKGGKTELNKMICFNKKLEEISRQQFQLFAKFTPSKKIDFYINNLSIRNPTSFVIDDNKGYALNIGNIININGNLFKIKNVFPVFSENDTTHFSIQPRFGTGTENYLDKFSKRESVLFLPPNEEKNNIQINNLVYKHANTSLSIENRKISIDSNQRNSKDDSIKKTNDEKIEKCLEGAEELNKKKSFHFLRTRSSLRETALSFFSSKTNTKNSNTFNANERKDQENNRNFINHDNEPILELEFFKNGPFQKKFRFQISNKDEEIELRIGSGVKNDIRILDEKEKYVLKNHCSIIYEPNRGWVIKDFPIKNKLSEFYKTFILVCGYDEYLDKKNGREYLMKGQRLNHGQVIYVNGHVFHVNEFKKE